MSHRFSNLILLFFFGFIFISSSKFFESSDEINFSFRLMFNGTVAAILCYILGSFFSPYYMKINQYGLYLILTTGLLLEITIRMFPQLVPVELLRNLSPSDRRRLAIEQGMATFNTRIGEGMLYHHRPFESIKNRNYIHIDSLGYRNPKQEDERLRYDVVLLGDSMIFAGEAEEDLGALYRKRGISALNLSMPGYAPQHYRDAYKKFVIDRRILNTHTFIFLFSGNDFTDAAKYERAQKSSGDWLAYADIPPKNYLQEALPWTLNIAMAVPDYVSGRLAYPQRPIILPYQTIHIGYTWFPPQITPTSNAWKSVKSALEDIIMLSRENDARPIIFLIPSPATIYSQFHEDLTGSNEPYRVTANTLSDFALQNQVKFIDLNGLFRKEISNQFIFSHERDCHFNQAGIQKLFDHLLELQLVQ